MAACVALWVAISTIAGGGDRPTFLSFGGDSSRGVLINLTPGMRPFDPPDPVRPALVFIHGCNAAPHVVHFTMGERLAEAIARRGGPQFSVLDWNWNAATFVGLNGRANEASALEQGRRLAATLLRSGVPPARIHLIGHSSGSIVAASAARTLLSGHGQPVAQLTLLDPAVSYHSLIFDVLAAGSSAPLVENHWASGPSGFGREVLRAGVWNTRVDGPTPYFGALSPIHSNHFHVVEWYLATVADPRYPGGFNTSLLVASGGR
jgi:pimeloyl-ACP methyl ester carboxylesterase